MGRCLRRVWISGRKPISRPKIENFLRTKCLKNLILHMHAKCQLSRFNNKKSTPVKPIPLNEYRRIQLQFATNKIKIGQLEPEIQPAKSV